MAANFAKQSPTRARPRKRRQDAPMGPPLDEQRADVVPVFHRPPPGYQPAYYVAARPPPGYQRPEPAPGDRTEDLAPAHDRCDTHGPHCNNIPERNLWSS